MGPPLSRFSRNGLGQRPKRPSATLSRVSPVSTCVLRSRTFDKALWRQRCWREEDYCMQEPCLSLDDFLSNNLQWSESGVSSRHNWISIVLLRQRGWCVLQVVVSIFQWGNTIRYESTQHQRRHWKGIDSRRRRSNQNQWLLLLRNDEFYFKWYCSITACLCSFRYWRYLLCVLCLFKI